MKNFSFMRNGLLVILVVALVVVLGGNAHARDWFVRAGSEGGDGSREKPFSDPYLALEKTESGDIIHVAAGEYSGKLGSGNWIIDVPNITLLGGYNANFTEREPRKYASMLRFDPSYKGRNSGTIVLGGKDHSNTVLDGFVLDQKNDNIYNNNGDIDITRCSREAMVLLTGAGCQIRNSVLLNGSGIGVVLGHGGRVENTFFMNMVGPYMLELRAATSPPSNLTVVQGNTFLFSWSPNYGKGGPDGVGVKIARGAKAELRSNIFASMDNHGVFLDTQPGDVSLIDNVFHLNGYSNVKLFLDGRDVVVDDSNLDELADVGFAKALGNVAKEPELGAIDSKWMEKYTNRSAAERGKVKKDDWNKARRALGLPLIAEGGKGPTGFAMAYSMSEALNHAPKSIPQGARGVKLEVKLWETSPVIASASYEPASHQDVFSNLAKYDGKRVAIPSAFGMPKGQFYFSGITEKDGYAGVELYDVAHSGGLPPLAYVKKGTAASRAVDEAKTWNGSAPGPTEKYLVKGVVKSEPVANFRVKGTLVIEAVEPLSETQVAKADRPKGRDWFVKAGASGGDGSKDKPLKDPFQAIEKAQPGDIIHVSQGEYFGKLKSGYWTIKVSYLSMLGGYDPDFKERDPWKRPTRLGFSPESKAYTQGSFIRGEDDHKGFILDGFVFDGRDVNKYNAEGDLLPADSSRNPLVQILSPDCEVRNSVFINGALGGVSVSGEGSIIENNIFVNHHWFAIMLNAGNNSRSYVLRNNTILFSWYDRADGTGSTSNGSGVYARTNTAVHLEGNMIGYSDVQAIFNPTEPKKVKVINNVFFKSLFAHYSDGTQIAIDDKGMRFFSDAGFSDGNGNQTINPDLPLDKDWMTVYLNRTMRVPGKVTMDDWNELRTLLGVPPIATGGKRATGYARPYPLKKALELFPRDGNIKAGARPKKL